MQVTLERLQAEWLAVPEPTRAAITAKLAAAAGAELRRIDNFYPSTYGSNPSIDVLGIGVIDGARRVHFLAHDTNYNNAQSGSDWADQYVFVGNAALDGAEVELKLVVQQHISEYEWEHHSSKQVVEGVRVETLTQLCGVAPPPKPGTRMRIVRCPQCGATDAGETEHVYEFTRMTCGACGCSEFLDDEQIKDDWNTDFERPYGERGLREFVPPLPSTQAGFELCGDGETRIVLHSRLGYAIAIPGSPRKSAPIGDATTQSLLVSAYPLEIVVRTESYHTSRTRDELLREELGKAAKQRAIEGSTPEVVTTTMLPPGACASMHVTYPRSVDHREVTELLVMTLKGEHPAYDAVFLYVACRARSLDAFAWANVRAALFSHQTWVLGELPDTTVWPATSELAEGNASLSATKRASDAAEQKAAALPAVSAIDAKRVNELLLRLASTDDRPSRPWQPTDTQRISQELTACAGDLAAVLLRDLDEVCSMHDFRAWCRICAGIVDRRSRGR